MTKGDCEFLKNQIESKILDKPRVKPSDIRRTMNSRKKKNQARPRSDTVEEESEKKGKKSKKCVKIKRVGIARQKRMNI